MTNLNNDLGTDAELATLVARIRGFDHDNATAGDTTALARALKIVADNVVQRYDSIIERESAFAKRLSLLEVTTELDGVMKTLRPAKRRRWWF